jgi:hypothetical protein
MRRIVGVVLALLWLAPTLAHGGFTETLPQGTFLLDFSYIFSQLNNRYNDEGKKGPLVDPIERYEPGGGRQGVLTPNVQTNFHIVVPQLHYGILDNLTFGVGVPVVLSTKVTPNMEWEPGDYQSQLGRPYSEEDFWQWAESMGQPRPKTWTGNKGVLADIQGGLRYRFTDGLKPFRDAEVHLALLLMGAAPTGRQPNPEELLAAGTTTWDTHSNGELGLHFSIDKTFKQHLDGRLTLGVDAFYEILFAHRYVAPTGKKNPLLLTYRPYVGKHYTLDPGDFSGTAFQIDVVPYRGPAKQTWLTKKNPAGAADLPPILTVSLRYTFIHLQQTDWQSESEIWDWEREKMWLPGYKNILYGQVQFSLLRVGAPLQPYVAYRNQTWIPGKNTRAADVLTAGTRVLAKFW